jgi:CBS domain containing-hemolysin-like protein
MIALVIAIVALGSGAALAAADASLMAADSRSGTASGPFPGDRERLHRALGIARVLAYLIAGAAIARGFGLRMLDSFPRTVVEVAVALTVVCVTEGASRAVAHARPADVREWLRPFTLLVSRLLTPVAALGALIEQVLQMFLPPPVESAHRRESAAERFREVVAAEAEISVAEESLLQGVFTMGHTEVHEIMVPRVDIVGIDRETPWSEVVDRVRSSEHSRLPVFQETLDDIVGILYAKDLLSDVIEDEATHNEDWERLIRPATFIPTSKRIDLQLRDFQSGRTHMAIVTDEFGGTAGLVTIEDILEEIVGEIRDEYDVEEPEFEQEGPDRFWVAGRAPVEELQGRLGVDLAGEDVTTVGGLVYSLFGRVPRNGEAVSHAGFRVIVERVRRRRIERVYFERMEPAGVRGGDRL